MLTPEKIRPGLRVKMLPAAGLDTDEEYEIASYDHLSDTVRLIGVVGSFSIYHIEGMELRPHIPAEEAGVTSSLEPSATDIEDVIKTSAIADLDEPALMAAIETHLAAIINGSEDAKARYNARMTLLLFYHLAGLGRMGEPE